MSYSAAANIEQRYGKGSLLRLIKIANNPRYDTLEKMADAFQCSKVCMCRYLQTIFVKTYVPDMGTRDFLENEKKSIKSDAEEIQEVVDDAMKPDEVLRCVYAKGN